MLRVDHISRREQGRLIVQNISFEQLPLQRVGIAGETGSGKTSLLKMIGGFVQPSEGNIYFRNQRVIGPEEQLLPGHPKIAYLSQHFELRNNYKVHEWLEMANKLKPESAAQVYSVCRIDHLLARRNEALSGGERQRIALARLLTTAPELLLLDEPFSNLDRMHKQVMKKVIEEIGLQLRTSCILVSHDAADLLSWADELLIMKDGEIVQQGSPRELYFHPGTEYVAGLLGEYNLLDASAHPIFERLVGPGSAGKRALLRPEQLKLDTDSDRSIPALISILRFMGSHTEVEVEVEGVRLQLRTTEAGLKEGQSVYIGLA